MNGKVVAVCISEKKGGAKTAVEEVVLVENHGIVGDAHAGPWHRQVSLLASKSIEKMKKLGADVVFGSFAENITTDGIELFILPVGTRMAVGEAELVISQIGKECHSNCEIFYQVGDCVMPKEGVFATVAKGGKIRGGDAITIICS